MRPDYVSVADRHGLKIPNLRRISATGAHARGVRGVLPTVTYPSHTTMMTGVWPAKHGIYENATFDPLGRDLSGWYWYSEAISGSDALGSGGNGRIRGGERELAQVTGRRRITPSKSFRASMRAS
jgi:hypothetical protein